MGIVSVTSDDNKHLIASIYAMWIEKEFENFYVCQKLFFSACHTLDKKGDFRELTKNISKARLAQDAHWKFDTCR